MKGGKAGQLTALCGPQGVGKGATALETAYALARSGEVSVVVVTMRVAAWQVGLHLLSSAAGLGPIRVLKGELSQGDWSPIDHAIGNLMSPLCG